MNVLPINQQDQAIAALTEGCSIRATERLTGVHRDTIMRLGPRPSARHIDPMVKQFVSHRPKSAPARKAAKPKESLQRAAPDPDPKAPKEIGGPSGPEPTRYGDWERKGICVDF